MCKSCHLFAVMATVVQLSGLSFASADDVAWVQVAPKETDEILANPGMGWETFHRTASDDKNLPAWIPSTVHYARWGWGTLEPEQGEIDYDFLDGILAKTRQAGQKLAFRAMCCSSTPRRPYHPKWLEEIGGKVVLTRYGNGPEPTSCQLVWSARPTPNRFYNSESRAEPMTGGIR
jgi:hypothetical protein